MKTLVSKTAIREAIINKDVQTLYNFAHKLNINVYQVIDSVRVARNVRSDAYWAIQMAKHVNRRWLDERKNGTIDSYKMYELKHNVIAYLIEQIGKPVTNYSKMAMRGNKHLYFCSPVYGHRDYNKWCTMLPLDGNEAFVDKVISISEKYFNR